MEESIDGRVETNAEGYSTRPDFVVHQNRTRGKQKKEEDSANNAI